MTAETREPLIDAIPGRHSGDLCFAGTRVPVSTMFECLAGGDSLGAFLAAFPSVLTEQARFALGEAITGVELGEQVVGAETKPSLICAIPGPRGGEVCFTGTNVPVRDLFVHLREGHSLDAFVAQRPGVTCEQTEFALREATAGIEQRHGLPRQPMPEHRAVAPER